MVKTLSPTEKLLHVYKTIAPYAEAATAFDRPKPHWIYDQKSLDSYAKNTQPIGLIDALLPQGGGS